MIIISQVKFTSEVGSTCCHVLSEDTDVFVLLIHFYKHFSPSCQIFMAPFQLGSKVISLAKTVDENLSIVPSLLAGHGLSGCDTVAAYSGIGKKTLVKVLRQKIQIYH